MITLVVVLLAGVSTVCVLAAPVLIQMMSPKIASDPRQMNVAVAFARHCLPTMFFMGVHVVLGQVLNARERFGATMWTPVLNNVPQGAVGRVGPTPPASGFTVRERGRGRGWRDRL